MDREPKLFSAEQKNKEVLSDSTELSVSDVEEKGDGYEIKLNGDIVWPCPDCPKKGIIKSDNKYYGYHRSNTDKLKERKCRDCFMKGNDQKDDIQERIAFHGSWNLAVSLIAPNLDGVKRHFGELFAEGKDGRDELEKSLTYWQSYFYKKLTERK